jgi:hypothetical protein
MTPLPTEIGKKSDSRAAKNFFLLRKMGNLITKIPILGEIISLKKGNSRLIFGRETFHSTTPWKMVF